MNNSRTFLKLPFLPATTAFIGSILLSLIALHFNPILGRDSAFYLSLAELYQAGGIADLQAAFNWPWLPILISWLQQLPGLSLIASGHLLMALLMACLCAVLVRTTALLRPDAAWWGCLVALSLPAFNSYRDAILREPGFWLFCALALLFAVRWHSRGALLNLLAALGCVLVAMVFRLEAIFLMGALGLAGIWRHRHWLQTYRKGFLAALLAGLVITLGLIGLALALAESNHRIAYYLQLLSPAELFSSFNQTSERFAEAALADYSAGDAGLILAAGFLTVILVKVIALCGPFLLVLWRKADTPARQDYTPIMPVLLSAVGLYLIVLMVFFMQHNFMIDRYVALVHVLGAPVIALAAHDLALRRPRTGWLLILLALITSLSNVVSLSDKRTHYLDAAHWIRENVAAEASLYYDDQRVAFYAGRGYDAGATERRLEPEADLSEFDYLVLDEGRQAPRVKAWIEEGQAEIVTSFTNQRRRELTILRVTP